MLNGGFETAGGGGADIWANWVEVVGDGALANEAVTIHTGADAAKFTAGAGVNTYVQQNSTVVPGATYKYRCWTRGDGTHDGEYSIYDVSNSGDIVTRTGTGVTGAAYAMVDVEFTAPAGCTSARLRLYCPDTDTKIAYFDTVSLRRTDVPTLDPHEGSYIGWVKADGAGVWTDATLRAFALIQASIDDYIQVRKSTVNNTINYIYSANGVVEVLSKVYSSLPWFPVGFTWSLSGDVVAAYINDEQVGTAGTLGTWVGNLITTNVTIGSVGQVPTAVHHGNLAHAQLYNTPLSADEMAYLMSLP
jgi:hypothetical protein